MADRTARDIMTNRSPRAGKARQAGFAMPPTGFRRRVLGLVLALCLLFNSTGIAVDGVMARRALSEENIVAGTVEPEIPEQDADLDADMPLEDVDLPAEDMLTWDLSPEGTALLSEILAQIQPPVDLRTVEAVMLPGSEAEEQTPVPLAVEPLSDEFGIYDYRITALEPFDEALLTVTLPEGGYTLVLSCLAADAEEPEVAEEEVELTDVEGVAEAPAEESIEEGVGEDIEAPAEEDIEAPAEEYIEEAPAEEDIETPVEEYIETPVEEYIEAPAVEDTEVPAEEYIEAPAVEDTEIPAEEYVEAPAMEDTEIPAEEYVEAPVEEYIETPVEEYTEAPAVEDAETPVEEDIELPTEEDIELPAEEDIEVPAEAEPDAPEDTGVADQPEALSEFPLGEEGDTGAADDGTTDENLVVLRNGGAAALEGDDRYARGATVYDTEWLRLSLSDGADAALGLAPAAVEAGAHQRVLEAWTATYRNACEGVYAELEREADAARGETLALYGLRDGALSPEPLMDGLSRGDGRLIDLREWDGFALVSASLYVWQQLPAALAGDAVIELSGVMPVGASARIEPLEHYEEVGEFELTEAPEIQGTEDGGLLFAFDIAVTDKDGEAFEPLPGEPLMVTVHSDAIRAAIDAGGALAVEHLGDAAAVALLGAADGAVSFAAEACGAYAVRGVIQEGILAAAGDDEADDGDADMPLTLAWPEALIQKELTAFNGDLATYRITVNPDGDILTEDGAPITLIDTFSDNQSINYASVEIACDEPVSYDFSAQTGTYTIPDGMAATITYTTRVSGGAGESVSFDNTARLGQMRDGAFIEGTSQKVSATRTITPSGSDIHGQGGVYTIGLFVYPDGHMERGLEGAQFRLLDSNMRPLTYKAGDQAGSIVTFTTDENGRAAIALDEATQGLSIRKNTVYFLEMVAAPYEIRDGQYIYYQKDDSYYSFMISDTPSYHYGEVYCYVNGDVLKVRCYPEVQGVNVTKRFSGNYTLTEEQKNAIAFILQKEALGTASGWVEVERHTYDEFTYGSLNFTTGREGGTELEDNATYRVIEENGLPEALRGLVEENVTATVSYQMEGQPVEDNTNEFYVDPDDKLAFSYDFTFTNEYVEHKLVIVKIDGDTGAALSGATFAVCTADGAQVRTYTTDGGGAITIHRGDEGANYASDTLYYAVETDAPEGYLLPEAPEKVYFYFSENGGSVPAGLPAGATAVDLSTSYDTVTIADDSERVNVPVTVVWGVKGDEAWPEAVESVVIGLYADGQPVANGQGQPMTVTLTAEKSYDTAAFRDLPARDESGRAIAYSVAEEHIYGSDGEDILNRFAHSVSVSGTGWHVVNNQAARSVVVRKEWYDLDDTLLTDTSGKAPVTFDLYRTTEEIEAQSAYTRAELTALLRGATQVRANLTLSADNGWTNTVESLEQTDSQGRAYHYYALEHVPDNQEDSYVVSEASEGERTLTIRNHQTPITVSIAALDLKKTYGDDDPAWAFEASVKEESATISVSGPDGDGDYTAVVTDAGGEDHEILFSVSRVSGEDVGEYVITPAGEALQHGYRVLFETGTLTIDPAEVVITAGAQKTYGEADPALVTVEGLKNGDDASVIQYTASREEGEDAGEYPITLSGETRQGNYAVRYVLKDDEGNDYTFRINRAHATVKANDDTKVYGDDDPEFGVSVVGLKLTDEPSVISQELTRQSGEDIGEYTITPVGDAVQGNYEVTFETGVLSITAATLSVAMVEAEKTYGEPDPEWEVAIDGLQLGEDEGELSSEIDGTGARVYTYAVGEGGEARTLFTFTASRPGGESVGEYAVTLSGEEQQGNYAIEYAGSKLNIARAELIVAANRVVKAVGSDGDPLLTAEVSGWKNGDEAAEATSETGADGTVTWTYDRDGETLLTFTLRRDAGEDEGEYHIAATGSEDQSNYRVSFEPGTFAILSVLDVDVKQPLVDYADAAANPSYTYTARLDLTGTGLMDYEKNGFEAVDGVPTLTFALPDADNGGAAMKTLKVPGGAKLTVTQDTVNDDYVTAVSRDGNPVAATGEVPACVIDGVNTYHEVAFTHSRISYPVEARSAVGQTEEGAVVLEGKQGAMGIPETPRTIDSDFADDMHSKIGYALPTDKYYVYDHASLYTRAGAAVPGATGVAAIRYLREEGVWQYRTDGGEFTDVPADSQLVLFYLPKHVCKIGDEKFYKLRDAVAYADAHGKTATIEMLIGEYSIRSASDMVTIPADCDITITTAKTEYEGTGTAVISRSMSYTGGALFDNQGRLTFDDIILDGKNVQASDAIVLNSAAGAELNVGEAATVRSARGVNGGAIRVADGVVNVAGTLTGNAATNGGAVYVNAGEVSLSGDITDSSATNGGAVYVKDGQVELSGSVSGGSATQGGAVYLAKGTLDLTGSLTENKAASGGAVYQTGGTLTVGGSMSQNAASVSGGAVYQNGGTFTLAAGGSLSGNTAAENGGAVCLISGTMTGAGAVSGNSARNGGGIYRTNGTLTVSGTLSGNSASADGGGIHAVGGTLELSATLTGNTAGGNGGAMYAGGVTLSFDGSATGNTASGNGGAVYALNSKTTIDASTLSSNTATANGGALYMEGGSLAVQGASQLNDNGAANGGAVYATSGAVTVASGALNGNRAATSGGAIYAATASVTVSAGTLSGNTAAAGSGGAIFDESGTVTIGGGSITGNHADSGNGGAVYAGSGTVNYTGGAITTNSAVNGAAIFAGSGIANVSASITGNTATNGGAIGVGGTSARLFFTGAAEVNGNTMNGAESNVYLDVDSELIINADKLGSGKKIGVYVPGDVNSAQVVSHGDVTGYFGAYTGTDNLASVFKNDRFSDLAVAFENNRLYWINNLKYDIYYLKDYNSQFPPTANYASTPSKRVCTNKSYAPRTRESNIYDLVMAMKLYEAHDGDFSKNVGANYASMAVYAYTYSDKAMSNTFGNYLQTIRWDGVARKWKYIKQDGTEAPANTAKLVIFYSAPAYLTIVNNNDSQLTLDISELNVLGKDAANNGLYGFVTAKNGATEQTLLPVTADDLKLNAGESIKLMFPGAQGQAFTLKGAFTGDGAGESTSVEYTFNGGTKQTITGTTVDFSTLRLNSSDDAAELIFGDALPICKIGDAPFSTLKAAMTYATQQKAATGNNTYKIEMLVDYLVPKDDVLEIPAGYDITFTTANRDDQTLPFTGSGERAILSRDTGNTGSSVTATNSTLTVEKLAFDGRSLTAGGKGGAVSATNCKTVTIKNCEFRGYRAGNGGAIYVDNKNADSSLTVEDCQFSNCQTNASVDKAGGGGVWTTARELYVRNCIFDGCACLKGSAQAGSIFHNIQGGWSANSVTVVSDCTFSNSYSVGGSGGTIESDALDVTIERCSFTGSYTNKSGGNGGAINVYANNAASTGTYCILRVIDCDFKDCSSKNGAAVGGAIRTTSHDMILRGCTFRNTQSVTGGAVAMTNTNAKKLEIYGCTFDNCLATGNGGAVSAPVPTVIVDDSDVGTYLDGTAKDGHNHFIDCTANRGGGIDNAKNDASVTMEGVHFTRCAARAGSGGALYTQAKTLSITGDANTFTDCTGYGSGGAVYQNRYVAGSAVALENCTFTGCEANNGGNGGGMYANASTLTISGEDNGFVDCSAANAGGGLYHAYAGTVTLENCGFDGCTAKADNGGGLYTTAHTLTITGAKSVFKDCTAQTDGGGLYQNRDANGSAFTFRDGAFEDCTAVGSYGGAIYTKAKGVTLADCAVSGSTAKAQGGGVWINPNTASFENCAISGNSVTNSDSRGGGVYVGGGTTAYRSGALYDCSAANGGGWYQNTGTLYVLGGSISGSATANGGGLYVNDQNARVFHYGGTVGGTAAGNGGGVYKNNGSYTIGDGAYGGAEYSGASIGGLITVPVIRDGVETTLTITSSATNGGGIYNNAGAITMTAGGSIGSAATDDSGEILYTATASANGGGAYIVGSAFTITGGVITNCQALGNGGGIYHAATGSGQDVRFYGTANSRIQNCAAENGGGVYINSNALQMGEDKKTSLGAIENCRATQNGGGVYLAGSAFYQRNGSAIVDCEAGANGGGAYIAGGTHSFVSGGIKGNTAAENGGGVYVAGGTFSMINGGAVIGGSEADANVANVGAGVFVANGQKASFNDWTAKTLEISHNHALTAGGGIAVGGPDAVLTFTNVARVRHNTMGANDVECNVYLDQDCNTVIQNGYLDSSSYIGVYASDDQDDAHGQSGMPFATWSSSDSNLNVYRNDRRNYLYGVKGTGQLVVWPEFVCKITDGQGNLLYKDNAGSPAVYAEVENKGGNGAFVALNVAETPNLYQLNDDGTYTQYTGGAYQVQMLVSEYEMGAGTQIKLDQNVSRQVTLTTASPEPDACGFKYLGDARFAATIRRTAEANAMIFAGGSGHWELTLGKITLDGGEHACLEEGGILRVVNHGTAILSDGATLQKGRTSGKAGGAVYLGDANSALIMNAGSLITGCDALNANGGGIAINNGSFTMNGGAITDCSAANGGGIHMNNSAAVVIRGGEITGNSATANGGGISLNHNNSRITFSGHCTVMGNTLNGARCNVQLNQDSNGIIIADGLEGHSEIGVYTTGDIYTNHGSKATPFGTWMMEEDKFFCFVNDREPILRGVKGPESGTLIYWEGRPLIRVSKKVVSDRTADMSEAFTFNVQLDLTQALKDEYFFKTHNTYGDMTFDKQGLATVKLKNGENATASLPFDFFEQKVHYTVTEDEQKDYDTLAQKDQYAAQEAATVTGILGENISENAETSTSLSMAAFTNTRVKGDLTVTKQVTSALASDFDEAFSFTLTLDDTGISKTYTTILRDESGHETSDALSFAAGSASFTLKHGQSLTIQGLPTHIGYTVTEELTDKQRSNVRTTVSKDGAEPVTGTSQSGVIGDHAVGSGEASVYASEVVFMNNFLEIVCKITNRSRELLYVPEANKNLHEAVFAHLEDAFEQINSGNLRTSGNGTVSGTLRIEMVVPDYAMERTATLNSGKTVILSTALITDQDNFPYNKGEDDGSGNIAVVRRGFADGSMIVDRGALTLDRITLDGDSISAEADGGVVNVDGPVRLTVNSSATLRNSVVSGDGGAIRLASGASLILNGGIENCSARSGGGVYADAGFTTITATGSITGCAASGDGGAICASTGTSISLNAGTVLTGNRASGNGGAVYSDTNLILRGVIGGDGAGNTAGGNGGGVCTSDNAVFTMYAGSAIRGNAALSGGGLYAGHTARIAGGAFAGNTASGNGGAVYGATGAAVTISGTSAFTGNAAKRGGAVYVGGSATMTGGSMTGNSATEKGGAVYVADGKTYAMTNGSVTGNKSPEGAVSTGSDAVLAFSGNTVIDGNTDPDGARRMNVYLGHDSNGIITTGGLGSGANIGVYAADGAPEGEVDRPIYYDHGISSKNFGTYTGSAVSGARLNKFVNDRDTTLTGTDGGGSFVAWAGKGLQLKVYAQGTENPVSGVNFTLTNADGVQVWTGKSDASGLVSIPWIGEEKADGGGARFAVNSVYTLKETAANGDAVLPAGAWQLTVGRDNSVTWTTQPSDEESVNQTLDIASPSGGKTYLGETFDLYNDVRPKVTYDATGGVLADNSPQRTDTVQFTALETSHTYTIEETNPTAVSRVFRNWATMEAKPADDDPAEAGYYEYARGNEILFFQGGEADSNAQGKSKGDITLYAQWDDVVCKITDRNGELLYVDGSPAVYGTLEAGFEAINTVTRFEYKNGGRATVRRIEMLVGSYPLNESVTLGRGKTVLLTTAPATDTDGYAYIGEPGTVCTITRGADCDASMIINEGNLTFMNITMDGDAHLDDRDEDRVITCDGGIVTQTRTSAALTVAANATLRNSSVTGNGGAINAGPGTRLDIIGGAITGNSATEMGGAVYVGAGSTLEMSGGSVTENAASAENGGAINLAGGAKAVFSGAPLVFDNPADTLGQQKNVVLSEDSNTVIRTGAAGLTGGLVGVYVVDGENGDIYRDHGMPGKPFGTFGDSAHANPGVFVNDRNPALTAVSKDGRNEIYWSDIVCKLTDEDGALLYREVSVTIDGTEQKLKAAAIYPTLEAGLEAAAGSLYYMDGSAFNENALLVRMLKDYTMAGPATVRAGRRVTLTTAETAIAPEKTAADGDVYAFATDRETDGDRAIITRGFDGGSLLTVNASAQLTLVGIALDGDGANRSASANGGIVSDNGTLVLGERAALKNSRSTGSGGAVYVAADAEATMTGGSIEDSSAASGGAVYVAASGQMTLSGGAISGNAAATAGPGVYLEEGATLNLSRSPAFDGNAVTLTGYADKENGGEEVYAEDKARQDIFLAGYAEADAEAIIVTGALVNPATAGGDGWIWVWAEVQAHHEMLTQFAKFTGDTIDEATLHAFRNAQDDGATGCGGDYLTGQEGDTPNHIYWTGGFDFAFRKVDGNGGPLRGATFTLYTSVAKDGKLVPAKKGEKDTPAEDTDAATLNYATWNAYQQADKVTHEKRDATGVSKNIAAADAVTVRAYIGEDENPVGRELYGDGLVVFEKIPPGNYFMAETECPGDWTSAYEAYRVYVDGSGWISISPVEKGSDGKRQWPDAADPTQPASAPTTTFVKDGDGKYTWAESVPDGADTLPVFNIMNVSTLTRKVILRKVDGESYASLGDENADAANPAAKQARFTVYYANMQTVVKVDGEALEDLLSTASGAFWIGKLPYGTYYLHETAIPSGYRDVTQGDTGNWFILTVDQDGTGYVRVQNGGEKTFSNVLEPEAQKPN